MTVALFTFTKHVLIEKIEFLCSKNGLRVTNASLVRQLFYFVELFQGYIVFL